MKCRREFVDLMGERCPPRVQVDDRVERRLPVERER
jgi:hypothetical protein